ncbi:DUF6448 family protein [Mesorhizobium sp. WSM4976]|uniref:DUF6448 family protein n=1 Tax=Mesorhizobium sp. WSM4976 TaxID=3038549 RepID=UPI0024163B24|nr:DUF6448 family protein [Mesorhizobium sp. WSM4976]MDG4892507.1 DUF6448 family protein [Mesorhizobium sp. WSM4976]
MRTPILISTLFGSLLLATSQAYAHCDSADGPVATAAMSALKSGNVNVVLPYVPEAAEAEIGAAFNQSRAVRAGGGDAKDLAERFFLETVVRLHRAGEGAPYTGLKPAGMDFGPAIPAAEQAIANADLSKVKALLDNEVKHGLDARFGHVLHTRDAPDEPQTRAEVAGARERVDAEFGFIAYVEGLRQAAQGALDHRE